jgi:hypothetical protein
VVKLRDRDVVETAMIDVVEQEKGRDDGAKVEEKGL